MSHVLLAAVAALAALAGGCVGWLLARRAMPLHRNDSIRSSAPAPALSSGLGALTSGLREVAAGDFTKNLVVHDPALTDLSVAINKLIFGVRVSLGGVHDHLTQIESVGGELQSAGGQALRLVETGQATRAELERGIREQVAIIDASSRIIAALMQAIRSVNAGAEEQRRTIDQVTGSLTGMAASIEEVAAQVQSLSTASATASQTAQNGDEAIHAIVDGMQTIRATIGELGVDIAQLGSNSAQIGDIVKVIDRIAEQTNLLALNAAIEAARAGEHGRGFAVVANEIRKLADGSSAATREIAQHIGSTQGVIGKVVDAMTHLTKRVEEGVAGTEAASSALRDIVDVVLDAGQQIGTIATVAQRMSENSYEVIRALERITRSFAENGEAAGGVTSGTDEVTRAFGEMAEIARKNAASAEALAHFDTEVAKMGKAMQAASERVKQLGHELASATRVRPRG